MTDREITPGSSWRHCRTGDLYAVVGLAKYASGPGEGDRVFVVYRSRADGLLWIRDRDDFLGATEGGAFRFEKVSDHD